MMDPVDWANQHSPNWVRRGKKSFDGLKPRTLLGEDDADTEWNQSQKPVDTFVHTHTYESLKRTDVLYLFGRRGTGKTALLRMLQHEVREGLIDGLTHCWIIQSDAVRDELRPVLESTALAPLSTESLMKLCRAAWSWVFTVSTMLAVVQNKPRPGARAEDLEALRRFVSFARPSAVDDRPLLTKRIARKAATALRIAIEQKAEASSIPGLFHDELLRHGYQDAELALQRLLHESKARCVVAVDAGEVYTVKNSVTLALLDGLIDAVRITYQERELSRIVAKAAFPAEIQTYLNPQNHDKFSNHALSLSWRYRDLLLFVAKRFHAYARQEGVDSLIEFNSVGEAEEWLYSALPRRIKTRSGFDFDALAYIIRHTQKKPRQLLHLFNAIVTLAESKRVSCRSLFKYPELLVEGVQLGLADLIDGVLGVYGMILPEAPSMLKEAASNEEAWFPARRLGQLARKASPYRPSDVSVEDLKRLLFEAGVIGKVRHVNHFGQDDKELPRYMLTATFEYQVKTGTAPHLDDICVIHPMLYEGFEIWVDQRVYVYPSPLEEQEQDVIRRLGFSFVDDES
jgi:hypothetical protein